MNEERRLVLGLGLAAGAALFAAPLLAEQVTTIAPPKLDPIPPLPKTPTPGKPHDFQWLAGNWKVHHRQPKKDSPGQWIEFFGEATVTPILAGVGSVEELRIPARDFSGMGLRLLDVENKVWWDHWVNGKSGVVVLPGTSGSFENGAGIFVNDDEEDGKPVKWVGVWDAITPKSCRWRSAKTLDGGKTWAQNWLMDWTRV